MKTHYKLNLIRREHATTVINMGTIIEIVKREKITSTVPTAKMMYMKFNIVTSKIFMGKNENTVTIRLTKKKGVGRNKILPRQMKVKGLCF